MGITGQFLHNDVTHTYLIQKVNDNVYSNTIVGVDENKIPFEREFLMGDELVIKFLEKHNNLTGLKKL